jgi:hypothetical protein
MASGSSLISLPLLSLALLTVKNIGIGVLLNLVTAAAGRNSNSIMVLQNLVTTAASRNSSSIGFFLHLVSILVTTAASRNSNGSGFIFFLDTRRSRNNNSHFIFCHTMLLLQLATNGSTRIALDLAIVFMIGKILIMIDSHVDELEGGGASEKSDFAI